MVQSGNTLKMVTGIVDCVCNTNSVHFTLKYGFCEKHLYILRAGALNVPHAPPSRGRRNNNKICSKSDPPAVVSCSVRVNFQCGMYIVDGSKVGSDIFNFCSIFFSLEFSYSCRWSQKLKICGYKVLVMTLMAKKSSKNYYFLVENFVAEKKSKIVWKIFRFPIVIHM